MTIQELTKKYQLRLMTAKDKTKEAKLIIAEINKLTYENGNKISNDDKIKILQELRRHCILEKHQVFAQDNKEYLELITGVIKALGGK